jgi:hypothetical protein
MAVHVGKARVSGYREKLKELSRMALHLQKQLRQAEAQRDQLARREEVLQLVIDNKSMMLGLIISSSDPKHPSSETADGVSEAGSHSMSFSESSGNVNQVPSKVISFPEERVLDAQSRNWNYWNALLQRACQCMALLLVQAEVPVPEEASRATAALHQEVLKFTEELTMLVLYCPSCFAECVTRNCDTGEVSSPSSSHWQFVARKAHFNKKQRKVLAAGFRLYLKKRQRLLLERALLQQMLHQQCQEDFLDLGRPTYSETGSVLDELMSNISQLNQAELTLGSLLWTTVCSPYQRAVLLVTSYPYWFYGVAGKQQQSWQGVGFCLLCLNSISPCPPNTVQ